MSVGSPLGFCPFCNTQVCVDEVVDDMKMIRMQKELDHETSIAKRETEYRLKKRKWDIAHGISMLVIGVLTFIAFFFAATERDLGKRSDKHLSKIGASLRLCSFELLSLI